MKYFFNKILRNYFYKEKIYVELSMVVFVYFVLFLINFKVKIIECKVL